MREELVRYALLAQGVGQAVRAGGVLDSSLSGVRVRIDNWTDELFIEVSPIFDPAALKIMSEFADEMGYEPMPEWECPPIELEDGTIRHWLVEKEDVCDSSSPE